jgi:hypothetical protein
MNFAMRKATTIQRRANQIEVTPELWETAWHEAGHAVAALVLGRSVIEVTVVPSENRYRPDLGHCRHDPVFFDPRSLPPLGAGDRERLEEETIISLAGPAVSSEKLRCPKGMPSPWRYDDWAQAYRKADHLARSLCVPYSRAGTKQYLVWLYGRAKAIIYHKPHWEAVRSVAKALVARRTLGHEETLAAYHAGLDAWTRDAQEWLCEFNEENSPRIPYETLTREQLVGLVPLVVAVIRLRRELCWREEPEAGSRKALHTARRDLDRHLRTLSAKSSSRQEKFGEASCTPDHGERII